MDFKDNKIFLERIPSELDLFALSFLQVLERHVDYVIVAGYVSILLGRSRATEDIDVFIKNILKEEFYALYEDVQRSGFWCLNAESVDEVFSYLSDGLGIRFAREGQSIPNFEVKYPNDLYGDAFQDCIIVMLKGGRSMKVSSLERQIAFKRYYLGSEKDETDALHIEESFKGHIDYEKVNKYKVLIETQGKHGRKR